MIQHFTPCATHGATRTNDDGNDIDDDDDHDHDDDVDNNEDDDADPG